MIELLVTVVIVSFGLLALAGLFLTGLRQNNSSYLRSLATQQAYDMADRMRANTKGVAEGNYDSVTAPGTTQVCTDCSSASCTSANIALYDACAWNNQNLALLPLGAGTVSRSGNVFTITVSWDDTRSGAADKSFVVRLEP